ncbi:arylsulfatase [Novipirellula artificiosorum]|nr:arylsulfatase [Novipirellula artificiosorum]
MHYRKGSLLLLVLCSLSLVLPQPLCADTTHPNMIFVLADDLGYGDLGCYGQTQIQTPRLDQMAREGMRFTQFYAGNTVCAPSRSVLMTGQHMGHTHVRGNAGGGDMTVQSLRDQDVTVAEVLKPVGYTNALVGKWGLGEVDSEGFVLKQGFDQFYGYLNQVHAHNYYPEFLWRGDQKELLGNVVEPVSKEAKYGGFVGGSATKRVDYSHDLFAKEAMQFIDSEKDNPFFLYLALTIPHANNEGSKMTGNGAEVPDYGIYQDRDWSDQDKGQAAMITRMDTDMGRIMDQLTALGIEKNTLVFFTSDNGPHDESRHHLETFNPSGPLRGIKRAMHEGGIRVPAIAWWPGTVPAGQTTEHIAYFGDWMATAAELAGVDAPENLDSISFVPTLKGNAAEQQAHDYLYWEFYEQGSRQAVRFGKWKAIREPMFSGSVELFDLDQDISEQENRADQHPEIVKQATAMMDEAHVPNPNWKIRGGK